MPRFSEDDVLNFMVTEALVARGNQDTKDAHKNKEREDFRRSHKDFDPTASTPPGG